MEQIYNAEMVNNQIFWLNGQPNMLDKDMKYNIKVIIENWEDIQFPLKFNDLFKKWKNETKYLSSPTKIEQNSNYQQIIGMGKKVVPLILKQLEAEPDYLFNALRELTGEDPVNSEDWGNLNKMTLAWLDWGRMNGFR